MLGINVGNINNDYLSIAINATIVIVLYIISFYYIDNKEDEKSVNARKSLEFLVKSSYQKCLEQLKFLDNSELMWKFVISKVNFNSTKDPVIENIKNYPFSSFDTIMKMLTDGFIREDELKAYFKIREDYQSVAHNRITFFDLEKSSQREHQELLEILNNKEAELKLMISEELERVWTDNRKSSQ